MSRSAAAMVLRVGLADFDAVQKARRLEHPKTASRRPR